jgi:hypothetical protein
MTELGRAGLLPDQNIIANIRATKIREAPMTDFDRSENTVELVTVLFAPIEEQFSGLTGSYDPQSGTATISFQSIEGSSALRIPGNQLAGLPDLVTALAAEVPHPPPDDDPESAEGVEP